MLQSPHEMTQITVASFFEEQATFGYNRCQNKEEITSHLTFFFFLTKKVKVEVKVVKFS